MQNANLPRRPLKTDQPQITLILCALWRRLTDTSIIFRCALQALCANHQSSLHFQIKKKPSLNPQGETKNFTKLTCVFPAGVLDPEKTNLRNKPFYEAPLDENNNVW